MEKVENDDLDLLNQVYNELRDAISFTKDLLGSIRHFKYFCSSLIAYSIIFLVLSFHFINIPETFMAATALLILCAINVLYALLLLKDYSEMRERYEKLMEIEKRLREGTSCMPSQPRTPVEIYWELLSLINKKGKSLKYELIKNLGSEVAFRRWFDHCFVSHKIVECIQEQRGGRTFTYYQKTKNGELLYETLKNRQVISVWLRISGKRLKVKSEVAL